MNKQLLKTITKFLMAAFYFYAGINHFLKPETYLPLIPEYFPAKDFINIAAGVAEAVLAIGLIIPKTQKLAAWSIILMLIAFIPAHVYFIQIGSCIDGGFCVSEWLGWVRLILIQPLLIFWAWIYTKKS